MPYKFLDNDHLEEYFWKTFCKFLVFISQLSKNICNFSDYIIFFPLKSIISKIIIVLMLRCHMKVLNIEGYALLFSM